MKQLKIGAVSYLNTKPLVYGLEQNLVGSEFDFSIHYDLPSRLADRLAADELDVALVPVVEAIANPDYTIVSDACIACRGPVWSVKLFSQVPFEDIRTMGLDEGSRTSAALARIILSEQYGLHPQLEELPILSRWQESTTDAVLVIGDRAMRPVVDADPNAAKHPFTFQWDLGEYWNDWTGLPFVFAVWAAHPHSNLEQLATMLSASRDSGLGQIATICQREAAHYNLDEDACTSYLTENLHFKMGELERKGLDLFLQYASKQHIIADDRKLKFYDCQTIG